MPESSQTASRFKFALRALRHRNYRLFFGGQSLSLIGTWMTQVATSWLVYRVTKSAFLLGMVGFSGQLPALLLTPIVSLVSQASWAGFRALDGTGYQGSLEVSVWTLR